MEGSSIVACSRESVNARHHVEKLANIHREGLMGQRLSLALCGGWAWGCGTDLGVCPGSGGDYNQKPKK